MAPAHPHATLVAVYPALFSVIWAKSEFPSKWMQNLLSNIMYVSSQSLLFIWFSIFSETNFPFWPKLIPKMLPLFWKHAVLERWDKNRKCVKVELTSCTLGWSKFCHGFQTSYSNKAEYTANEVAFGWAGAIFEVTRPLGQEQWGQRNKIIKKIKRDQPTNRPTDGQSGL